MKNIERILGFVITLILFIFGKNWFGDNFYRLFVGLGFGYALTRGYMGFAGSVNRSYRMGTTKLLQALMIMFLATTAVTTAFTFRDHYALNMWINPINFGMILGGLMFGFGMSYSSCCATGVLTDIITGLPRAIITLVFFGFGVFIAYPLQVKASWVTDSWISVDGRNGVFLPDLFMWDGMNGFLGASILTAALCAIVVFLAKKYEDSRKARKVYDTIPTEEVVSSTQEGTLYEKIFVNTWSLKTGAIVIVAFFTVLTGISGSGWGASTIHGIWFAKTLNLIGVPAEALADLSLLPLKYIAGSYLDHPVAVQNFGIIMGTLIYLLTAGIFKTTFLEEIRISFKEVLLFAMGGLFMGIGTRLSNGCNVGALYTPISQFSLSGWLYFIFLVSGGVIGNRVGKMGNLHSLKNVL